MRIPRAPSYMTVFLFGAVWNAVIERSLWATGFCLGCAFLCWLTHPRRVEG